MHEDKFFDWDSGRIVAFKASSRAKAHQKKDLTTQTDGLIYAHGL